MIASDEFPRLTAQNHRVVSSPTTDYNCIAWCATDTQRWWQPGIYWPCHAEPEEFSLATLKRAFAAIGYEDCSDGQLESGFEKVALYDDGVYYTHAARQLPSGKWTSKLGRAEDIEHDTPEDVAGGPYGAVAAFMKRPALPQTS